MKYNIPYFITHKFLIPSDFDCVEYVNLNNLNYLFSSPDTQNKEVTNFYLYNLITCSKKFIHYKNPLSVHSNLRVYSLYDDLHKLSKKELVSHYVSKGAAENRIYKLPDDFDFHFYKILYKDVEFKNKNDIIGHFLNKNADKIYNVPANFDIDIYKLHNDLVNLGRDQLKIHYLMNGKKDNRKFFIPGDFDVDKYKELYPCARGIKETKKVYQHYINSKFVIYNYPDNFDFEFYKNTYPDLIKKTNYQLIEHYFKYGKKESRMYCKNIDNFLSLTDADLNIYKKINFAISRYTNVQSLCHFYNYGIHENRLFFYPNYNKEFIKSFYYFKDIDSFIQKYLCSEYIIHYEFALKKFNYHFIYTHYKLCNKFKFNMRDMYNYISENESSIQYFNSRQLVKSVMKPIKTFCYIYAAHFTKDNIKYFQNNLKYILDTILVEKVYVIFSIQYEEVDLLDVLIKKSNVIYINVLNIGYDIYKYFVGIYFLLQDLYENDNDKKSNVSFSFDTPNHINLDRHYYVFINNSVNLVSNLNNIVTYYTTVKCDIVSYTDSYQPCVNQHREYKFHLASYFFIVNRSTLLMYYKYIYDKFTKSNILKIDNVDCLRDKVIQEFEVNIFDYYREQNVMCSSLISVDDYLPLFHLKLHTINLSLHTFLIFRNTLFPLMIKSIKYDYFLKYIPPDINIGNQYLINYKNKEYIKRNLSNLVTKHIAFVIHIGNDLMVDDYLIDIEKVLNYKLCNFTLFISICENLIYLEQKIRNYLCKLVNNIHICCMKNKGGDIGPFLLIYKKYLENNTIFDFVLKYHTKTDTLWRRDLQFPFENLMYACIVALSKNGDIAGICSGNFLLEMDYSKKNNFCSILHRNNLGSNKNVGTHFFCGGTIFMYKYDILKKFLAHFDLVKEYDYLEVDIFMNNETSDDVKYTHCWERLLSSACYYVGDSVLFPM